MPEGLHFQSVLLGDGRLEVSFIEDRHMTKRGMRVQTLQFSLDGLEEEYEDLVNALAAIVDAYEVIERDPPQRIAAR